MRNISFAKTTWQVGLQRKTVTRRVGWLFLKRGDFLQPVVKGQGIPKGGTIEKIGGPIRVVSVRRELLSALENSFEPEYGLAELVKEGFPDLLPKEFIDTYFHGLSRGAVVTRIEFEYMERIASETGGKPHLA